MTQLTLIEVKNLGLADAQTALAKHRDHRPDPLGPDMEGWLEVKAALTTHIELLQGQERVAWHEVPCPPDPPPAPSLADRVALVYSPGAPTSAHLAIQRFPPVPLEPDSAPPEVDNPTPPPICDSPVPSESPMASPIPSNVDDLLKELNALTQDADGLPPQLRRPKMAAIYSIRQRILRTAKVAKLQVTLPELPRIGEEEPAKVAPFKAAAPAPTGPQGGFVASPVAVLGDPGTVAEAIHRTMDAHPAPSLIPGATEVLGMKRQVWALMARLEGGDGDRLQLGRDLVHLGRICFHAAASLVPGKTDPLFAPVPAPKSGEGCPDLPLDGFLQHFQPGA